MKILLPLLIALLTAASATFAELQPIDAFAAPDKWVFNNGQEFPGAKGDFQIAGTDGKTTGILEYDFSGGGAYVCAGFPAMLDEEVDAVGFSLKADEAGPIFLRVVDASGECFQFKAAYAAAGEWENILVALHKPNTESWGGDGNKTIDLPIKSLWFGLARNANRSPTGRLSLTDIKIQKPE